MWLALRILLKHASHSQQRGLRFFILYFCWLLVGTLFYAYAPKSNLGIVMGFFMAINIGYSIGFGFPAEPYNNYLIFSSLYVIVGASFVAMALSFFADRITENQDNWFTNLVKKKNYEAAFRREVSCWIKCKAMFKRYLKPIRSVSLWFLWILAMTIYSRYSIPGWDWQQAQYFAISTCSTGGHYPIPSDSPQWLFGLTAIMMSFGVPLNALACVVSCRVVLCCVVLCCVVSCCVVLCRPRPRPRPLQHLYLSFDYGLFNLLGGIDNRFSLVFFQ